MEQGSEQSGAEQRHEQEMLSNLQSWKRKPLLRQAYTEIHRQIKGSLAELDGPCVELGSGIGSIKETIPNCICTDTFPSPHIDQCEDAYDLSFADNSLANLILIDVFHHLRYPGMALDEFARVLMPGGRMIIYEPAVSLLGRVVYGLFHKEPLALSEEILWRPDQKTIDQTYYAAQGNAHRMFVTGQHADQRGAWEVLECRRLPALVYLASGGYSGRSLIPRPFACILRMLEPILACLPAVFATRMMVVCEKNKQPKTEIPKEESTGQPARP